MPTPLQDSTYAGVGFAVLAVRQAQEAVSDIQRRLDARAGTRLEKVRERVESVRTQVEEILAPYAERARTGYDQLFGRLPEDAQKAYKEAIKVGKQVVNDVDNLGKKIRTAPAKPAAKNAATKAA